MNDFWIKLKKILKRNFINLPFEFRRNNEDSRKEVAVKVESFKLNNSAIGKGTKEIPTSWNIIFVIIATLVIITIFIFSKLGFI